MSNKELEDMLMKASVLPSNVEILAIGKLANLFGPHCPLVRRSLAFLGMMPVQHRISAATGIIKSGKEDLLRVINGSPPKSKHDRGFMRWAALVVSFVAQDGRRN